jgi:hypothetical protein
MGHDGSDLEREGGVVGWWVGLALLGLRLLGSVWVFLHLKDSDVHQK